jgi:hypothetical protein
MSVRAKLEVREFNRLMLAERGRERERERPAFV